MFEAIRHIIAKLLVYAFDKQLLPPNRQELNLIEELRSRFRGMNIMEDKDIPFSEEEWARNANRLRVLVLNSNPIEFLRWDVVLKTMFVTHASYVQKELNYLKSLPEWKTRWCRAIRESRQGHPIPYPFYPTSSGNLIHQAYHLAQFEEKTGVRLGEMKFVFEFGGGYGSMCRLFHNMGFNGTYIIFDLPYFSALQEYYLKSVGIQVCNDILFKIGNVGVICVSDLEQLGGIVVESLKNCNSIFVATWSISEVPIILRNSILPLISHFTAFLIAYQHKFGEVDNLRFFREWKAGFDERIVWNDWQIKHLPGNNYLVGKKVKT